MTPSLPTIILQGASALAIALFSAWVTVRLSQRKFRAERLWDRKANSYERLIEAFHKSKRFSSEHLAAEYKGRNLPDEKDLELRSLAQEAHEEIRRNADIGSFTLSKHALDLLSDYEKEIEDYADVHTWYDHLEHDYSITDKYMKLLIDEAKRDLGK